MHGQISNVIYCTSLNKSHVILRKIFWLIYNVEIKFFTLVLPINV